MKYFKTLIIALLSFNLYGQYNVLNLPMCGTDTLTQISSSFNRFVTFDRLGNMLVYGDKDAEGNDYDLTDKFLEFGYCGQGGDVTVQIFNDGGRPPLYDTLPNGNVVINANQNNYTTTNLNRFSLATDDDITITKSGEDGFILIQAVDDLIRMQSEDWTAQVTEQINLLSGDTGRVFIGADVHRVFANKSIWGPDSLMFYNQDTFSIDTVTFLSFLSTPLVNGGRAVIQMSPSNAVVGTFNNPGPDYLTTWNSAIGYVTQVLQLSLPDGLTSISTGISETDGFYISGFDAVGQRFGVQQIQAIGDSSTLNAGVVYVVSGSEIMRIKH